MPHDPRLGAPGRPFGPPPGGLLPQPGPAGTHPGGATVAHDGATPPLAGCGALYDAAGQAAAVVERVTVAVTVEGLAVRSCWTVRFHNTTPHDLEALYLFPLPVGAAVVGAVARFGDHEVRADLAEREAARAVFDAAVAAGHRAGLVEADRREVFTLTLGHLRPGEHPEVTLELVAEVDVDADRASVRLPLLVAPRYSPAGPAVHAPGASGTVFDPDASRVVAPRAGDQAQVPPVVLEVHWQGAAAAPQATVAGCDLTAVDGGWLLRWAGPADRDVIVSAPIDIAVDRAVALARPGGGFLVRVDIAGGPAPAAVPRDVVVLLDRSGSMGGWKMPAAQRLAARIVDSLNAADRVLVIGFDHVVEASDTQLAIADAANRRRIGRFVEGLDARGGTELAPAISAGCSCLHHDGAGRDKVLVMVTDAQVSDEANTTAMLATVLGDAQVYVVGVDRAVNAGLCRDLASVGGGRFDLVTRIDELGAAADRVVSRIGRPVARGVGVAGADRATWLPRRGADVYAGTVRTLWAHAEHDPTGTALALVSDHGADRAERSWLGGERTVTVVASPQPRLQAQLWAAHELAELDLEHATGVADAASRAVPLSLAAGVLCRFTAFIAVDHAGVPVPGPTVPVIQPLAEPAGWAFTTLAAASAPVAAMVPRSAPAPMMASASDAAAAATAVPGGGGRSVLRRSRLGGAAPKRASASYAASAVSASEGANADAAAGGGAGAVVGAGLRKRVLTVLGGGFERGHEALDELLDDLATLTVPEVVRHALGALRQGLEQGATGVALERLVQAVRDALDTSAA